MNILVINCGSSSVKYQVLDEGSGTARCKGIVERIGDKITHADAIKKVMTEVDDFDIQAVGHRVVHGGPHFTKACVIDDDVLAAIEDNVRLAPLHNPPNLAGIKAAMAELPDISQVAVFDTAFHSHMPKRSKSYALPKDLAQEHGWQRFGFHGTSHHYVANKAAEFLDNPIGELRIFTLHLGNGCSVAAVEYGHSVDTSMGLTPMEGLVMGTRVGDVDPGIVLSMAKELGAEEAERVLNKESGLKGLSGGTSDMRDLQNLAADGQQDAQHAINVFAHQARKYVGGYAAVMGGVDAVVLTGGIGENSADMRQRILQRLEFLGLRLDLDKNRNAKLSADNPVIDLSTSNSRVKALAVATNEELQIAKETAELVRQPEVKSEPKPIPIAVSARHVHLTQEALEVLFGKGYELTPYKPLSQPGQFAAEEKVDLIGPRTTIKGVRILGPLRPVCQIEVSRTDEFALGIDAPVRRSGQVKESAPITLRGPKGTLELKEGLICAWRHIHMTEDDAAYYGVKDGDEVSVSITGGIRDLTFGDVLVRVKDSYKLEMHIDTDEANAAELGRTAEGDLIYSDVYVESTEATAKIK